MEINAVFSGGGVKGIALVGALSVLEQEGYRVARHAGTSAGAIVCGLHAAGYTAEELRTEWMAVNFRRRLFGPERSEKAVNHEPVLEDEDGEEHVEHPNLLKALSGLKARFMVEAGARLLASRRLGIFPSTGFEALFRKLLEKKGVRTFRDLGRTDLAGCATRYRVQMVGADITRGRMVLLPEDIVNYEGFDSPDDLDVALAMRISMSIPAFFRPVALREKQTGKVCYLVDGGLLSQFPIAYFETHGCAERPTIGFRLERPPDIDHMVHIHGPVSLLLACALTALEAHDARLADSDDWLTRTVLISGQDIPDINFLLSDEQKESLYDGGVQAARAFLDNPASRAYLESFRRDAAARSSA